MKAFLSHSSADKHFVKIVFDTLGTTQSELDEHTFEYTFNVQAIRNALNRSDVFVYFLSSNSVSSSFVVDEQRAALEARGRGILSQVIIFAIDHTSYKALPKWMQDINIVQRLSSPKACARRIQAALLELDAQRHTSFNIFLGRDPEKELLQRAVSAPPEITPIAIHAVGHQGIGRRTYIRRSLGELLRRQYGIFAEITLNQYDGIDDLYRSLYGLHVVSSISTNASDFERFSALPYEAQISSIATMLREMRANDEFIIIDDGGSVYTDDGDYQPFLKDVLEQLQTINQPAIGFCQTRMMPFRMREQYPRSFHQHLHPLPDSAVEALVGLGLKECRVDFTAEQVAAIVDHLDGHPYNVRFAIKFIQEYGIDSFIADPSDLIIWKRRRAEDFLQRLTFSSAQIDILCCLSEYRYMATEMLVAILGVSQASAARDIRTLVDFCCVERRSGYSYISAPLRDALRRDSRFHKSDEWRRALGSAVCDVIKDYKDDDAVSVPILESATIEAARNNKGAPEFLSRLILPSHLLRIARQFYDDRKTRDCLDFCKRGFEMRDRMPADAQVEMLRLWGLAGVRLGENLEYARALELLSEYHSRMAQRVRLFLQGFKARNEGRPDDAERFYLDAWKLHRRNASVNRELAMLYCKQGRYPEAETFARESYGHAPTNPFIIDIFVETLLGLKHASLSVDESELTRLLDELKTYGDAPGSSFYLVREAHRKAREGDLTGALRDLNKAVDRTPTLLAPYFQRADVFLSLGDPDGADKDLTAVNRLLTAAGGFAEGDEAKAAELEVRILIERKRFQNAKDKATKSAFLPKKVEQRLLADLARAIRAMPHLADNALQGWAQTFSERNNRDSSKNRKRSRRS